MARTESSDLLFSLEMAGDDLRVVDPTGRTRTVTPPWKVDNQFWRALHFYDRLTREPVPSDVDRADLFSRAKTLGSLLFEILFDENGREQLRQAMIPGRPRPLITIRSNNDPLLALPWELLCQDGSFLLKEARMDLARSTAGEVGPEALLREPDSFLKLVVNVSAPDGSGLDYEGESYRVTKALSEQCQFVPTELGTLEDLAETVRVEKPTAIHFSGHGAPASLVFEDDEGRADVVPVDSLLRRLRARIEGPLPPLFFLASCHGNDIGGANAETSAACLHREGVAQVVGYDGPINDELSTRAEVAFYRALAEGRTTREAVRQAREALSEPSHPFAWAQLVLYHRGPDHPLSLPAAHGLRQPEEILQRTFTGAGDRKILTTGFIGRRSEMHEVRRRIRRGDRVLVFQGLGGLGKSTLAFHVLPMLQGGRGEILALWCQEVEQQPNRLEGLVGQLLDHCRKRFGLDWEQIVYQVDRAAGDDSLQRFTLYLQALLQNVPRLVLYLDNLESLQVGPKDLEVEGYADVIGEWATEDLGSLWKMLSEWAGQVDHFYIVASCRYRNPSFAGALLPVSSLPPDAVLRLLSWFPSLRQLSFASQVLLVERLAGHPRAVEYADDLLAHALAERGDRHGPWQGGKPWREWSVLVEPVLPTVQHKLQANLLLAEIWDRVLTEHERRMLYRMTLLRQPWEWPLMAVLGEEGEGDEAAFAMAERLRRTSLLDQVELLTRGDSKVIPIRHFALHPATAQMVRERLVQDEALRTATYRRLGDYLEQEARRLRSIGVGLEAGYHLFQAGEYDRALELLGAAWEWFQSRGRVREGLRVLEPFLALQARDRMAPERMGNLLGATGLAHFQFGDMEKAIEYLNQALLIHRQTGNRHGEGTDLGTLGLAYAGLGEVEKAIGYYEQALAIARAIGDRRGEANALGNLGGAYHRLGGEVKKAISYYERQLTIAREVRDRRGESTALGSLGLAYASYGDLDKAIAYYEQSLVIDRNIGDRFGEGTTLGNLGVAYMDRGEVEKAIECFEQQLVISRETGHRQAEGRALGQLGIIYACLGEVNKATALLEQTLAIARAIKDLQMIQNTLANLDELRSGS
jgi:tetratricopeptide (TPR) repeat protein